MSPSCETIHHRLQDKRATLVPPAHGVRCIMFWYDPEQEFADCLEGLELIAGYDNKPVKIHKVESFFKTKYILEHLDTDSHYLVYVPEPHPSLHQENWLIDIELYSEDFKADSLAIAMDECRITHMKRYDQLKKHFHFFGSQERKESFRDLYDRSNQKDNLQTVYLCMLAVCVGSKSDTLDDIMIHLFKYGLDEETNKVWSLLTKADLLGIFWEHIGEQYGYNSQAPKLANLWYSLYFAAIIYQQPKAAWLMYYNTYTTQVDSVQAYHLLDYWIQRSDFSDIYTDIIQEVETKKEVVSRVKELNFNEVSERRNITISPLFEKVALRYCKSKVLSLIDYSKIADCISYRKQYSHWYKYFGSDYQFIEHVGSLLDLIDKSKPQQKSVDELWNYYVTTGWQIDFRYRNALYAYDISRTPAERQNIIEEINNRYTQRVREINDRWYNLLKTEGYTSNWGTGSISKQQNFWKDFVETNTGPDAPYHKAIVIISDAMRYEVAQQLKEQLSTETRGESDLQTLWGVAPSFTPLGMASLLPHQKIEFTDLEKTQTVSIDGISTAGIDARKKILSGQGDRITAIKRDDFGLWKTKEEQAPFMTKYDIVYIYHNIIDSAGEKDEHSIPKASQECIDDLIKIIKRCCDTFNFTQVIVTADHGFLYQRDKLTATDKTRRVNDDVLQESSRFALRKVGETENQTTNDLAISLSYLSDTPLTMNTPRADMRYQKQGANKHFAHGGVTLQEITIPVLHYRHKQSRTAIESLYNTYTEIQIISLPRVITTNEIIINIFQMEPLLEKMKSGHYSIVIKDSSGNEVSKNITFTAESKDTQPDQRNSKITLSLLPHTFSGSENYSVGIKAEGQDNNNYTQSYPVKISIGIIDDYFSI